jgi:hypothetical protein
MAAAEKISVSIAADDLRWAKQRAKREVKSLSAVVAEALRGQRQAEARARLLVELGTDDITPRDRDEVREQWRTPPKQGRASKRRNRR